MRAKNNLRFSLTVPHNSELLSKQPSKVAICSIGVKPDYFESSKKHALPKHPSGGLWPKSV